MALRILLCSDAEATSADVLDILRQAHPPTVWHPLTGNHFEGLDELGLIVIESHQHLEAALKLCRRLRACLLDRLVPILFLLTDAVPEVRQASLEAGADTYLLRPFTPGELLAQVAAFLRLRQMHDRLADQAAEVRLINKQLQQAYRKIDQELELARRIQLSFLPQTLPVMPAVRFAVCYRPCGQVGGDFYDVFRLDENHVGFYVADAMGHGLPASLLTIFVKKGVRAKEIFGQHYRLLSPEEVLTWLNRDMLEQGLSETPFITMVYALLDCRTLTLRFARAGHPHPVYVPREGPPCLWEVRGSLLGVFETEFISQTRQLYSGDKLLLYTDGVETSNGPGNESTTRLLDCAARHQSLPVQQFLERLAADLLGRQPWPDDFTLLGLEVQTPEQADSS